MTQHMSMAHHDPRQAAGATPSRPREPGELFGFERELWDDRASGRAVTGYRTLLARASAQVDMALDRPSNTHQENQRLQAMSAALDAAREVLTAAARAVQQAGHRGGPVVRG